MCETKIEKGKLVETLGRKATGANSTRSRFRQKDQHRNASQLPKIVVTSILLFFGG